MKATSGDHHEDAHAEPHRTARAASWLTASLSLAGQEGLHGGFGESSTAASGPLTANRPSMRMDTRSAMVLASSRSCVTTMAVSHTPVAQLGDQLGHELGVGRVEPGRGLVEEQDLGLADEGPGDPHALAHPARQLGRQQRQTSSPRPTSDRKWTTRRRISARRSRRCSRSGYATFSYTDSESNKAAPWNT